MRGKEERRGEEGMKEEKRGGERERRGLCCKGLA